MNSRFVLAMFATTTLLACSKTEDVPAPAPEAPAIAEPAPMEAPAVEAPPLLEPTPIEPMPAEPAASAAPTPAAPAATQPAPAAKAATPTAPAAPKPAPETPKAEPEPAAADTPKPDLARGEQVYRQSCAVCHASGVAGAPKTGDKAAWAPRLAKGADALYSVAINGKGAMPAKGGNPSLSDADVKAAVDYLIAQSR